MRIMCLADEELVDHLLLNCKVAQGLWSEALSRFHYSLAHPRSICGLFEAWMLEVRFIKGRIMWRTTFLALLRIIWKEMNFRCFEDSGTSAKDLTYMLKLTIASWVPFLPQFHGISIDIILRNCREVVFL